MRIYRQMVPTGDFVAGVSGVAALLSLAIAAVMADKLKWLRPIVVVLAIVGIVAISWAFFFREAPGPVAVLREAEQRAIEKAAFEEAQRRIAIQRDNEEAAAKDRIHEEALKKASDEAELHYTEQLLLSNVWVNSKDSLTIRFYPEGKADYLLNQDKSARYVFDKSHVKITAAWGFGESTTWTLVRDGDAVFLSTTYLGTPWKYLPVPISSGK